MFENPDRKVRVEIIYRHLTKPHMYVRDLDGSSGKYLFTDELECTLLNSKRARKNWVRRGRARSRKWGKFCFL